MKLEDRVSALEAEQVRMRAEWKVIAQAPLLNGALLSALRETQAEHSMALAEHTTTLAEHSMALAEHTTTLAEHTTTLAEHTHDLAELRHGVRSIVAMLTTLIERDGGAR